MNGQHPSSGFRGSAPAGIGRHVVQTDSPASIVSEPTRSPLGPLIGLALVIGIVASAASAFEYLAVDQYLVSTDRAYVVADDVTTASSPSGVVPARLAAGDPPAVAGQVLVGLRTRDDMSASLPPLTEIVARAAGIVATRAPHVGDAAAAGRPPMSSTRQGRMYVLARFQETEMTYVAVGQAVTLEAPALGEVHLYGYVANIVSAGEDRARQRNDTQSAVKIVLRESNPPVDLRPGMLVRATINTGLIDSELLTGAILNSSARRSLFPPVRLWR